jgi:hypothetical protein
MSAPGAGVNAVGLRLADAAAAKYGAGCRPAARGPGDAPRRRPLGRTWPRSGGPDALPQTVDGQLATVFDRTSPGPARRPSHYAIGQRRRPPPAAGASVSADRSARTSGGLSPGLRRAGAIRLTRLSGRARHAARPSGCT